MEENKVIEADITVEPQIEEQVAEPVLTQEAEPVVEQVIEPVAASVIEPKQEKKPAVKVRNEDFDWSELEDDSKVHEGKTHAEVEAEYERSLSNVQVGEVVEGTVVEINKREVTVNIGHKSEATIPATEFRYNPELAVGEKVEVYVESLESRRGQLMLSHKIARQLKSWDRVKLAMENDEIIKGYVKSRTKGGMIVDVFGIEAFLPGSQIDVKPIRDYDVYVDKAMEFKVVKINEEFRNVVVSHKALIEEGLEQQRAEIMSRLEKGQILEGIVKNITTYGVFVDLGGIDGLIHITDLSWGRVVKPEDVVSLDQTLKVVILDFDEGKKRIALGVKQLLPHPWDALDAELKVGDKINGKVMMLFDYGAFIEVSPGVEGLMHVSEMSWNQHLRSAQDFLKVGQEIEAVILQLDRDEHRLSLGMKQLGEDPWNNIEQRFPIGSKHTAKVRNFTGFGVFVEVCDGIDGLIHISDLSWMKKIKHPSEITHVGAEIDVVVIGVDKENRHLSLGHKQLEENPWVGYEQEFALDSVHEGKVTEVNHRGAVVELKEGIEGFVPAKQMTKEDGSLPKVGDVLPLKVIEFSRASRHITLSHIRTYNDNAPREGSSAPKEKSERRGSGESNTSSDIKRLNAATEKTTLGDISELAELKAKMEESAKPAKATRKTAKKEEETAE